MNRAVPLPLMPALVGNALVQRQRLWDQIGDLNNGGFLAHRNPKESEDEPEILRPTHAGTSRKAGPRYSPRHAQAPLGRAHLRALHEYNPPRRMHG